MTRKYTPPANTILDNVELISLEITTWSGGAQLKPGDVPGLGDLPERAFSLGRKYLIAPERLKAFTTLRSRARNRCFKVGTRLLGGYAVPAGNRTVLDELYRDLDTMKAEFDAEKRTLISTLGQAVDEWISEPEVQPFEALIRAAVPSSAQIEHKLGFRYIPIRIAPPAASSSAHVEEVAQEMGNTLMGEIAQCAKEIKERFLERNKTLIKADWTFSGRASNGVQALRDKLAGLSFIDSRLTPVVNEMDRVLRSIPKSTKLTGDSMRDLFSLLTMLSEEERMKQYGEALLAAEEAMLDMAWDELQAADPERDTAPTPVLDEPVIETVVSVDHEDEALNTDEMDVIEAVDAPAEEEEGVTEPEFAEVEVAEPESALDAAAVSELFTSELDDEIDDDIDDEDVDDEPSVRPVMPVMPTVQIAHF